MLATSSERIETEISMAQRIQTLFIDDLDGSEAEGAVHFALDGMQYEIDLNTAHAKELRKALTRYTDAARRITGPTRRRVRSRGTASANGAGNPEVRAWAKSQGIEVKDRGRVPAEVVARYQAATAK
jgi:hypothetical protein